MSEAERVKLLDAAMRSSDAQAYLTAMESAFETGGRADDAAMRSSDAQAYLTAMESAFETGGRADDATTAASLRLILQAGEVELLMFMRAEWLGKTSNRHARPARST